MICGGIIGLERSRKNRPAGFRTYMIVCLSSALVMMTNQYIYNNFSGSDPARLGAQVISGIGFLGAGTIMITSRNQIKG
ncbi:MAG TPA: magnesium transporter, partial [Clostridiales bacterium]|nr:magnesium transporter [Clostridiales bacterium]